MNLSTDGQRPGERMMLILGLRFLGRTRPGEHPKGRVFLSTWVEKKKMRLGCHQINDPTADDPEHHPKIKCDVRRRSASRLWTTTVSEGQR